jgi:uncharacterized protein
MHGSRVSAVVLIMISTLIASAPGKPEETPTYDGASSQKELFVPMRDGVHLSTDILLPKGTQGRSPALLVRTPYQKDAEAMSHGKWAEVWLRHGYALVIQNERGRLYSEGTYSNYLQGDSTDGYDTIGWIVKQPWSNGKVGTVGCSSSGEQQWPVAASNPPGLAAMIAAGSGTAVGNVTGNDTQGAFYRGGIPVFGLWAWWYGVLAPSERFVLPPNSTREQRVRLREGYTLNPRGLFSYSDAATLSYLPSGNLLRHIGAPLGPWDRYITWTPDDPRWDAVERIKAGARPSAPALHVSTWYDIGVGETTRLYKYLQDQGTPNQYLIVGAGPHCSVTAEERLSNLSVSDVKSLINDGVDFKTAPELTLSDLHFGDIQVGDARYGTVDHGYADLFLRWFDHWLKGDPNHVIDMPKVQLYVMGEGWISGDQWPLKTVRYSSYYLDGNHASRSNAVTGSLSNRPPDHDGEDSYFYDPRAPVPTLGGSCCGVADLDQRPVEARKDVLVYSTPPLDKPTTIAGPIEVVLYVSSSAKDSDFVVKLLDVYPDGKSIDLADDGFRVRYREGFGKQVFMQSGKAYKIRLTDMVTAIRFPKGHRIRLDVSSSNFPLFERNLNTGGNNYDETNSEVAENSIHFGRQYPSHIVLPELPGE